LRKLAREEREKIREREGEGIERRI